MSTTLNTTADCPDARRERESAAGRVAEYLAEREIACMLGDEIHSLNAGAIEISLRYSDLAALLAERTAREEENKQLTHELWCADMNLDGVREHAAELEAETLDLHRLLAAPAPKTAARLSDQQIAQIIDDANIPCVHRTAATTMDIARAIEKHLTGAAE